MPLLRCPHCGEDTFTIKDWADLDRCANCGRPLQGRPIKLGAALEAHRQLPRQKAGRSNRPRPVESGYESPEAGTGSKHSEAKGRAA